MQTEDRRACTDCGAGNTPDATSCWQCFSRFDAPMPPAAGQGRSDAAGAPQRLRPGFPPPSPVSPIPVAPAPSGGLGASMVLRVVVGFIAAFLGFVGVQRFLGGGGVEIPESAAGVQRMHDGLATQFEDEMKAEGARYDIEAQAAAYGSGEVPDFLLVVVNGSTWETTDEMFDSLVQGMTEAGATMDTLRRTGEVDGASYRCVGAEAVGAGFGVCMWRADDHVGIVLDIESDTRTAETLMQSVYRDISG